MDIFPLLQEAEYENLYFCHDNRSGLKAIIAIHSTALGPALGGTRVRSYASEQEAVLDALRLARSMSYKNAVADLGLGGGKGVILADPKLDKSRELFRAYGRFIERLCGAYITAEDAGTTTQDMDWISEETQWVVGTSHKGGEPSPYTARGVFQGIKAALQYLDGSSDLNGKVIAIQGSGNVGSHLCRMLGEEGARLLLCDLDDEACGLLCEETGAKQVSPEEIHRCDCDVFAPCAMGGAVNEETIKELSCRIVAGGANNILASQRYSRMLQEMGVLYVPDYVVNAGGVICVADQLTGFDPERVKARVDGIRQTCLELFRVAEAQNITTTQAADIMAERRMAGGQKPED